MMSLVTSTWTAATGMVEGTVERSVVEGQGRNGTTSISDYACVS